MHENGCLEMTRDDAKNAVRNGAFAALAWLLLDWAVILTTDQNTGDKDLFSQPDLYIGTGLVIACIVGLLYKSRLAAVVLLLFFLLPQIVRFIQGQYPTAAFFILSLVFLYYFVSAVIGAFSYHQLKTQVADDNESENNKKTF